MVGYKKRREVIVRNSPKPVFITNESAMGLTIKYVTTAILTDIYEVTVMEAWVGHMVQKSIHLSLDELKHQAWRLGRLEAGKCYYMFDQDKVQTRAEFKKPEAHFQ
jgi:hypothetical protein